MVIKSIRETSIDDPNRLASHVLTVLREYIGSQMTACPHLVSENESRGNIHNIGAIGELFAKITDVDREALHRYYVDKGITRANLPGAERYPPPDSAP